MQTRDVNYARNFAGNAPVLYTKMHMTLNIKHDECI